MGIRTRGIFQKPLKATRGAQVSLDGAAQTSPNPELPVTGALGAEWGTQDSVGEGRRGTCRPRWPAGGFCVRLTRNGLTPHCCLSYSLSFGGQAGCAGPLRGWDCSPSVGEAFRARAPSVRWDIRVCPSSHRLCLWGPGQEVGQGPWWADTQRGARV